VLIVPHLSLFLDFPNSRRKGTTLAMLVPPVGILLHDILYNMDLSDVRVALIIVAGFVVGSWWGHGTPPHYPMKF